MKKIHKKIVLSIAFSILFCFQASKTLGQDNQVRIAFMGNSITYGAGLPSPLTQSYPAQLSGLLAEQFGDTCIIGNFGVSGRTMLKNGDFPLWDEPEFADAIIFRPHIVVIVLGTK